MFIKEKNQIKVKISIPSVRDDRRGFYNLWDKLFSLEWSFDKSYFIELNFTSCNYAGVNMTSILGAFVFFVRKNLSENGTILKIETKTMNQSVYKKLKDMGLLEQLDKYDKKGFINQSDELIKYQEFPASVQEDEVISYLNNEWLGKNRLNFSEEVKNAVLSSLWEVYANAIEHSGTKKVQSCGSYDKKNKTLSLLVGDLGGGIVGSVKSYLKCEKTPKEAIEWALIKGNSTYTVNLRDEGEKQPRGLGLYLLTQLIDINGGSMEIYTDSVFYSRELGQCTYIEDLSTIKGTWVRLTLKCLPNVRYFFKSENIPEYF